MVSVPIEARYLLDKIEDELVAITGGELDDLHTAVEQHEVFLSDIIENEREDEGNYRNKHKVLEMKFSELERRYKTLKKEIFQLVKMSPKNNQ